MVDFYWDTSRWISANSACRTTVETSGRSHRLSVDQSDTQTKGNADSISATFSWSRYLTLSQIAEYSDRDRMFRAGAL